MKAAKPLNLAVTPTEAVKAEAAARPVRKSSKLNDVCYDIRGPVLTRARQMEDEGHKIIKLNIGNPGAFEFEAPDEILQDVIYNLPTAQAYSDSKGLFSARKAVDRKSVV